MNAAQKTVPVYAGIGFLHKKKRLTLNEYQVNRFSCSRNNDAKLFQKMLQERDMARHG
jgi:hypothetical protein